MYSTCIQCKLVQSDFITSPLSHSLPFVFLPPSLPPLSPTSLPPSLPPLSPTSLFPSLPPLSPTSLFPSPLPSLLIPSFFLPPFLLLSLSPSLPLSLSQLTEVGTMNIFVHWTNENGGTCTHVHAKLEFFPVYQVVWRHFALLSVTNMYMTFEPNP